MKGSVINEQSALFHFLLKLLKAALHLTLLLVYVYGFLLHLLQENMSLPVNFVNVAVADVLSQPRLSLLLLTSSQILNKWPLKD